MLNEIAAGTVLIVSGGTGLYPFSDLIDLLFKDNLVKKNHPMKGSIEDKIRFSQPTLFLPTILSFYSPANLLRIFIQ